MVCQKEARDEIAASARRQATRVTTPTWNKAEHLYSCTYVYPNGKIVLVGEGDVERRRRPPPTSTASRRSTAPTQQLIGLGQGAWVLKNNDVVVRKDYKVLLVDVAGHPGSSSRPLMTTLRRRDQRRGRRSWVAGRASDVTRLIS